jgi:hypothetical protein
MLNEQTACEARKIQHGQLAGGSELFPAKIPARYSEEKAACSAAYSSERPY